MPVRVKLKGVCCVLCGAWELISDYKWNGNKVRETRLSLPWVECEWESNTLTVPFPNISVVFNAILQKQNIKFNGYNVSQYCDIESLWYWIWSQMWFVCCLISTSLIQTVYRFIPLLVKAFTCPHPWFRLQYSMYL